MRARFAHIGDAHLGPHDTRNTDRLAALDQILDEVLAEHAVRPLSAWLWPGDVNHRRMSIDDRNALIARAQQMASIAPVIIAYGNHDVPGDLDFLAALRTTWPVRVLARPEVIRVHLATGGEAVMFVLPYPHRFGLVGAGVPHDLIPGHARAALDLLFAQAASELAVGRRDGCVPLMIGHVNVGGSILANGQPNIGQEIELDPTLLQRLGPIYVGLNHIHKAQTIGGAHYAGSVCRLDWGETDEKRYVVVDAVEVGEDAWQYRVTSRAIAVAPMFHVEGFLSPQAFALAEGSPADVVDRFERRDWTACEVRVRYRFDAAQKSAIDDGIIRELFATAARLTLDPIAERTRAIRAAEIVAAQSLEEKVQAFVRAAGVDWRPSLETKLTQLQSPDGVAFLTEIESSLSGAAGTAGPALARSGASRGPSDAGDAISPPSAVLPAGAAPDNQPAEASS
jgi:DNA repair exonuclease SbcCD nuclease subunit